MKIPCALLLLAVLGGCAIREPVQMQTQFDYSEHSWYMQPGSNTVKGQGFLRQQGGGVVTCAGSDVYMVPATRFFREAFGHVRAGKQPQTGMVNHVTKTLQCDAQGGFNFSNVTDGNWFVMTKVQWIIGGIPQGGVLMREVSLGSGLVPNTTFSVLPEGAGVLQAAPAGNFAGGVGDIAGLVPGVGNAASNLGGKTTQVILTERDLIAR